MKQAVEKEELTKQIEAANAQLSQVREVGGERRERMARELTRQNEELDEIKAETEKVKGMLRELEMEKLKLQRVRVPDKHPTKVAT